MNAVIVAFLLAVGAGWLLTFLGFALFWLIGLLFYAFFLMPNGASVGQYVISLFALGVAAQVGFFASVLLQVTFGRPKQTNEGAEHRSLIGRVVRLSRGHLVRRDEL